MSTKRIDISLCVKVQPAQIKAPRIFYHWHVLSLDAPTVAVLWTWFIARSLHTDLPPGFLVTMFASVWILYASDRLLDVSRRSYTDNNEELEERHYFHGRYRAFLLPLIGLAAIVSIPLICRLPSAMLQLYVGLGAVVVGYFFVIHWCTWRIPKEFLVGSIFAAAVFVPSWAYRPELQEILVLHGLLVANLCVLNLLFIRAWERALSSKGNLALSGGLLTFVILIFTSYITAPTPICAACVFSVAILLYLHVFRFRFEKTALRISADVALLTPLFALLWMKS